MIFSLVSCYFWVFCSLAQADELNLSLAEISEQEVILKYQREEFRIKMSAFPQLLKEEVRYSYANWSFEVPEKYLRPDLATKFGKLFSEETELILDENVLKNYLEQEIRPKIEKKRQDVKFFKNDQGQIEIEGVGQDGQKLDITKTIELIKHVLLTPEKAPIRLPLIIDKAQISTNDSELQKLGITEILAVGKSDFSGSTSNRINNIQVGSKKLSHHLISAGGIFSVGETLGPVDGSTGYKQELVIKGPKTVPEYGGGLCQVSSTLYRGALAAGLPIIERINHSYAVSYYLPWGTDATIYPPTVDLKFQNNTKQAILLQSYMEKNNLYFILYGTDDGRQTELFGPFISNYRSAPPPRIEYSEHLAPGEKEVLGQAHPGFDSTWYRYVTSSSGAELISETIFSRYQARPLYHVLGKEEEAEEAVTQDSGV